MSRDKVWPHNGVSIDDWHQVQWLDAKLTSFQYLRVPHAVAPTPQTRDAYIAEITGYLLQGRVTGEEFRIRRLWADAKLRGEL